MIEPASVLGTLLSAHLLVASTVRSWPWCSEMRCYTRKRSLSEIYLCNFEAFWSDFLALSGAGQQDSAKKSAPQHNRSFQSICLYICDFYVHFQC